MTCKPWWTSKTLWLNLIALLATIIQGYTGFVVSPELQGILLTVANIILRAVTNQGIEGVGRECKQPNDWGP